MSNDILVVAEQMDGVIADISFEMVGKAKELVASFGGQVIALVLGSGCGRGGALDVANELLTARGGLHGMVRATPDELAQVAGVGVAKAARLMAAIEAGQPTLSAPDSPTPPH